MDLNVITSQWFENDLPIEMDMLKQVLKTEMYFNHKDGLSNPIDAVFFITNETKSAIQVEGGKPIQADRVFPPLIMVVFLIPKDGSERRVYWTNLCEYALCFLANRYHVNEDIERGFESL